MNTCSYINRLFKTGEIKMEDYICKVNLVHEENVLKVKAGMDSDDNLYELSELFKVFGDQTRVKILSALVSSELCVCDIAYLLNMSQSAISHQLRILKQSKLVKFRKDGKVVFYSIHDEHVKEIIDTGMSHVKE